MKITAQPHVVSNSDGGNCAFFPVMRKKWRAVRHFLTMGFIKGLLVILRHSAAQPVENGFLT